MSLVYVFFIYGLAFFCMGLVVMLEGNRASDERLRHALRPLAVFGLVHGCHEWLEMFFFLGVLPGQREVAVVWEAVRLGSLTLSFVALATFGAFLLASNATLHRLSQLLPVLLVALWGWGVLTLRGLPMFAGALWDTIHVWTRYVLAVPSALLAAAGLIVLQRVFRQAGLIRFGRDSLWAAVAFAWYGLVGQLFAQVSPLPPSQWLNQELFMQLFGFPIQFVRAITAVLAAVFVIRFLRAFEVETERQIAVLQEARLEEAQRREALRGELLQRIVTAQEAERQRVARELHDATGQTLTALGLGLRGVTAQIPAAATTATAQLEQLEVLTANALDELRHLIADLRPPHLDDLGLPATLRWYAKEVQARARLQVQVDINGPEQTLPSAVKLALFRIMQEALTNTLKHSRAQHARVSLVFAPHEVCLQVRDDGQGFDLAAQPTRPTWGVLGMQERVTLLNGHCTISSQPGQGTTVQVTIPLQQ